MKEIENQEKVGLKIAFFVFLGTLIFWSGFWYITGIYPQVENYTFLGKTFELFEIPRHADAIIISLMVLLVVWQIISNEIWTNRANLIRYIVYLIASVTMALIDIFLSPSEVPYGLQFGIIIISTEMAGALVFIKKQMRPVYKKMGSAIILGYTIITTMAHGAVAGLFTGLFVFGMVVVSTFLSTILFRVVNSFVERYDRRWTEKR